MRVFKIINFVFILVFLFFTIYTIITVAPLFPNTDIVIRFFVPFIILTIIGIIISAVHMIITIKKKTNETTDMVLSNWGIIFSLIAVILSLFIIRTDTSMFEPVINASAEGVKFISQDKNAPDKIDGNIFITIGNLNGTKNVTGYFNKDEKEEFMIDSFDGHEISIPTKYRDGLTTHSITIAAANADNKSKLMYHETFYFISDWIKFSTNQTVLNSDTTYIINKGQDFDYEILLDEKISELAYGFDSDPLIYVITLKDEPVENFTGKISVPEKYADGENHRIDIRVRSESGFLANWHSYFFRIKD